MKWLVPLVSCLVLIAWLAAPAPAATQQDIQQAIDDGLAWLDASKAVSGSEAYWSYPNNGTLAATAAAALAFIGEGYLPGDGSMYGDTVQKACNYVFNRAANDTFGKYFNPSASTREVYTTGICTPVVYELGKALGPNSTIGMGSAAVSSLTYRQLMQGVMDWFTWGQNPDGGWRYYPNYGGSDNSTAQWGALPYLYGAGWGLSTPAVVAWGDGGATTVGLEGWTNQVQNPIDPWTDWRDGGSGYSNWSQYVNMAKTGGMLLEFAVQGKPLSHPDVQAALYYMQSMETFDHWNQGATTWPDQWYGGHLNNPYAMWAVFKGLEFYNGLWVHDNGTPGDPTDDFLVGNPNLIATAPGGFTIGQDWNVVPLSSVPGDWYSHYCDYLVAIQNGNGSWSGYQYWTGALATSWYINILNATGAPPPPDEYIPEPGTMALFGLGLIGAGLYVRRRRRS